MDPDLVALLAMVAVTLALSTKWKATIRSRPGYQYHRVFSLLSFGLLLLVAGLIGWDLRYMRGWFHGAKWVEAPIWWQVGAGSALLLVAFFFARRVPPRPARR